MDSVNPLFKSLQSGVEDLTDSNLDMSLIDF